MLKSPPLVATLSDSMRMSPCSWGDIFTWPLRGDRIIGLRQLFFQYSPRLNEQATVNGFLRHSHALVIGIVGLQPSGNLFRRPVQDQFTRNDIPQLAIDGKKTPFWSQR